MNEPIANAIIHVKNVTSDTNITHDITSGGQCFHKPISMAPTNYANLELSGPT